MQRTPGGAGAAQTREPSPLIADATFCTLGAALPPFFCFGHSPQTTQSPRQSLTNLCYNQVLKNL